MVSGGRPLEDGPWRTALGAGPTRPAAGRPTATLTGRRSSRPLSNRWSERATGSRMAVRHAVQRPSTGCRPLGLPTSRPLMPSAGGWPTRTFVRTLGRLDASGQCPSDVIFPKDVRCDNPDYALWHHIQSSILRSEKNHSCPPCTPSVGAQACHT
jgi:hypothetical protein